MVGFVWRAFPREAFGMVEDPAPHHNIPELIPAWNMEHGVTVVTAWNLWKSKLEHPKQRTINEVQDQFARKAPNPGAVTAARGKKRTATDLRVLSRSVRRNRVSLLSRKLPNVDALIQVSPKDDGLVGN